MQINGEVVHLDKAGRRCAEELLMAYASLQISSD